MEASVIVKEKRIEVRSHLEKTFCRQIKKDVYNGLTASKKSIPSKYFYDSRGSELFEKICYLPEYYPTRTEMSILKHAAPQITNDFPEGDLVELGSGANWKIRMLLDSIDPSHIDAYRYVPVDVSESALISASEELLKIYPSLKVLGIIADFLHHMDAVPNDRPRLILFLGSTIGNFTEKEQRRFLNTISSSMKSEDRLLVGFDMIKPKETLEAAYNDSKGITSKFNKNVLHVMNRELNANFNPSHFEHLAFYNEDKGQVEMHLQAQRKVEVAINDLDLIIELEKNETIHTEISSKFSQRRIEQIVEDSGLSVNRWFNDSSKWFSLAELVLK